MKAAFSLLAAGAALTAAAPAEAAPKRVPQGFAGTMLDRVLERPGFSVEREMSTMVSAGVESVRVVCNWSHIQRYRAVDDVPADERSRFRVIEGVPTDFTLSDRVVGSAAQRGLKVLPVLTTAPFWAAKNPGGFGSPPAGTANYARYALTMVRRYGPRGSFWRENPRIPKRPIRDWQVWNEPNLRAFWNEASFAADYVKLLRAGRRAILEADRGARIVLAGLANRSFEDLGKIYRQPGARRLFDVVAVHPYTVRPIDVPYIVKLVRRTMRHHGDARKPTVITEMSWPSSDGKLGEYPLSTNEANQARRLRKVIPLLVKVRRRYRLEGFYWYTWVSEEEPKGGVFAYSGLRRLTGSGRSVAKPSYRVYRRAVLGIERCRRKAGNATRCVRAR